MRGSSQPLTRPSSTSVSSLRLLRTVYVRLSRANSICLGRLSIATLSSTQSYSGRCTSNSSVQSECVMPSIESDRQWVKSYIG